VTSLDRLDLIRRAAHRLVRHVGGSSDSSLGAAPLPPREADSSQPHTLGIGSESFYRGFLHQERTGFRIYPGLPAK
jgi:hypothetical protein